MPGTDGTPTTRRDFLKYAGVTSAAVSIAGCSGDGGDGADGGDGDGDGGDGDGDGDGGDGGMDTETETETETPEEDFAVTITQGQMDSGLDPQDHRETPTDNIVLHAYEGLLTRDREGSVIAGLATDWSRVGEGQVKFTLRDDVQFHNGDDLTPEDVAFSINRIVQSDVGDLESPQSDQLAGVTGAEVVPDERAVAVMSDGINPIVFALFASYCDVMQRSWVENNDQSFINQNMNGTGKFQLSSYEQDVEVVFEPFEDHWDGPPAVDELTFNGAEEASTRVNQLINGETDITVNVPPQEIGRVQDSDAAAVAAVPSTRIIFNAMRYDAEPFSSQQFRQAMNYAIDLNSIIENVLQTFADPTGQPTLEGFTGYNPDIDPYPHDPDQAEQLVDDSGHAGVEISLHTPVGRYLKDLDIAQAVASQINDLSNVSCEVEQRDFGALVGELVTGNIEDKPLFYLIGWGNATFDASQTIIPLITTGGALTTFEHEPLDDAVTQAQQEADPDTREQLLQEANQIAHDQAPWVFLNRQYSVYGKSARIDWEARRDERIDASAIQPQ